MVAARGRGYEPRLVLFPSGGKQSLIARVDLKSGIAAEVPHYRAIGERHTNRSAYDRERDLARAVIEAFNKQVLSRNATLLSFSAGDREGKLFAEGTIEATARYIADPSLLKDSHHWFRYSLEEVNEKRDGLSVSRAEYQLARIVNDSGLQAVFGFRCGYAKQPAKPAPRRGVNEVVEAL